MDDQYVIRQKVMQLWDEGEGALKGGWYERACKIFESAQDLEKECGLPGWTSRYWIAKTYRTQGREREAIQGFESALPLTAAILELISIFRVKGKAAIKSANTEEARRCFNAMLSMSFIARGLQDFRRDIFTAESEDRAARYISDLRAERGTLYGWTYERDGAVPEDKLLSNRDYATMHKLTFGTG